MLLNLLYNDLKIGCVGDLINFNTYKQKLSSCVFKLNMLKPNPCHTQTTLFWLWMPYFFDVFILFEQFTDFIFHDTSSYTVYYLQFVYII